MNENLVINKVYIFQSYIFLLIVFWEFIFKIPTQHINNWSPNTNFWQSIFKGYCRITHCVRQYTTSYTFLQQTPSRHIWSSRSKQQRGKDLSAKFQPVGQSAEIQTHISFIKFIIRFRIYFSKRIGYSYTIE